MKILEMQMAKASHSSSAEPIVGFCTEMCHMWNTTLDKNVMKLFLCCIISSQHA